eukprot:CAMPEP_0196652012 /NCGR_PEP_ID=MMETSP1086-20130531/1215_1 /TAXON_ID=77921 /ORGANISM="Cyanoptyche  gloeocystis , Strain SAG4.97" /LENGTH=262 /DNA_ID=CAMNT_0041982345 /DNA_START=26 /DNA_END=809 /DNA_ORIENTATION=-
MTASLSQLILQFQNCVNDDQVSTLRFLSACDSLLPIFDVLAIPILTGRVKADVSGNIQTIRSAAADCTDDRLLSLIAQERDGVHFPHSPTCSLLWLNRALRFIHVLLSEVELHPKDLRHAVSTAYARTLANHHPASVQLLVRGGTRLFVGHRDKFLTRLGPSPAIVLGQIRDFVPVFGSVIERIDTYYALEPPHMTSPPPPPPPAPPPPPPPNTISTCTALRTSWLATPLFFILHLSHSLLILQTRTAPSQPLRRPTCRVPS